MPNTIAMFYDRLRKILPRNNGSRASDHDINMWLLQLPARHSFRLADFHNAVTESPFSPRASRTCQKALH